MTDIRKYYGTQDELFCPYCGKIQFCHEPEDFTSYICTTECEHCGREIEYSVEVTRTYYPTIPDEADEKDEEENKCQRGGKQISKLIDADTLAKRLIKLGFYPAIVKRAIEVAPTVERCEDG